MALTWTDVEHVPEPRRGRRSQFLDLVESLGSTPTRAVVVAGEDVDELDRFYRSFVQWRLRHQARYPALRVRKADGKVYAWLDDDTRPADSTKARRSAKYVLTRGDVAAPGGLRRAGTIDATGQKLDRGSAPTHRKIT